MICPEYEFCDLYTFDFYKQLYSHILQQEKHNNSNYKSFIKLDQWEVKEVSVLCHGSFLLKFPELQLLSSKISCPRPYFHFTFQELQLQNTITIQLLSMYIIKQLNRIPSLTSIGFITILTIFSSRLQCKIREAFIIYSGLISLDFGMKNI